MPIAVNSGQQTILAFLPCLTVLLVLSAAERQPIVALGFVTAFNISAELENIHHASA